MEELAEGYFVLYAIDGVVQLTLLLIFISQILTTRHLQKQRKLYEKEYVVRQGRHPVASSRRPSANVQLSPLSRNKKGLADDSDTNTTVVSPRLGDGKRMSVNPSTVRAASPVPFTPPPQIGRIPRFLHITGLLASILQVVRAVDMVSLNGFYPTLFVRFLSNGTSLVLLYGGCAVVDDFIGLRYKMVFSRTPPVARRVIIGLAIVATLIIGAMLAIRSVHDWRFTLGTYNLVWGFSALILAITLNASILKLSYRINSTDNAFLVKYQRPSTNTPQLAPATAPDSNPELATLGSPALPTTSSGTSNVIVVEVASPLPSPTPGSETFALGSAVTPGGPTPGGPAYSATFAQMPALSPSTETPTGDAPATINESQSVDNESSVASDARMLAEQSARPSLVTVRLEPVPSDPRTRSDSTSTVDNQPSVSRDHPPLPSAVLAVPSSPAAPSSPKGSAAAHLQIPAGQAAVRSSMFSPNPNAFHVALRNMRLLALCTSVVGIAVAAFAVITALKYFTDNPFGPQIVPEPNKPWSDDLTPIIIQTFILALFVWYAWVPIPLFFRNFLAEYDASSHSEHHALASPVAVVREA